MRTNAANQNEKENQNTYDRPNLTVGLTRPMMPWV